MDDNVDRLYHSVCSRSCSPHEPLDLSIQSLISYEPLPLDPTFEVLVATKTESIEKTSDKKVDTSDTESDSSDENSLIIDEKVKKENDFKGFEKKKNE